MPPEQTSAKIDDQSTSASGLADDDTDSVTVDTEGAQNVHIYVDDDADPPGDHAGYELTIETQGNVDGTTRDQEQQTIGGDGADAETARMWSVPATENQMTITLTNRSGAGADHGLRAVSKS